MTPEERRKAAWIVFEYEREMYLDLHDIHARNPDGVFVFGPGSSFGRTIINSLTEARVLHANILCEMLTGLFRQGTYFSIADMLDGPTWPQELYALASAHGEWLAEGTLAHACHFRVKTPGACRGDSFDYSKILEAIHEPLVAAMDAVIERRRLPQKPAEKSFREQLTDDIYKDGNPAAEVRIDENRRVNITTPPGCEVAWGQGGKIVDLGPKPRFVKLKAQGGGDLFVNRDQVFSIGTCNADPPDTSITRITSTRGTNDWCEESPAEVVAKLEGRA